MSNTPKRLPSRTWMRPTTNKVREALISTLLPYLPEAMVLDLFAGTGSLGLAALDAGAREAVFIESDPRSLKFLAQETLGRGKAILGKLPQALERVQGKFDIIVADPPYNSPEGPLTLQQAANLLTPEGWLVFEHHHKEDYPDDTPLLTLVKRKRFGETALSFWRLAGPASTTEENDDSDS